MAYRYFLYIFVFLMLSVYLSQTVLADNFQKQGLKVSFLNIGQGDAALIGYLGDYQILIDGGPNGNKLISSAAKEISPLDGKIEIVVLTHPDKDHYQGLIELLEKYEVGLFIHNGSEEKAESYGELKKKLEEKNVRIETALEGSDLQIGKYFKMNFFNPDGIISGQEEKNGQSIVARLDFGENSFLFMGDAEFETEDDMIGDGEDVDVDFLKVGHHGSKNATGVEFLKKATPEHSVISVGQNSYGHPTEETLERLKNAGSGILRTDKHGTVNIVCENLKTDCKILK